MALGGAPSDITVEQQQLLDKNINLNVDKASIKVQKCVIASMQRLETEDEIKKRKEEEEKKAAAETGAKKKHDFTLEILNQIEYPKETPRSKTRKFDFLDPIGTRLYF